MKNIFCIAIITIITVISVNSLVSALDRSIFPSCKVLKQDRNKLFIQLDKEITSGTDTACYQAEKLIDKIKSYGYTPVIVTTEDTWLPNLGCQVVIKE